MTKILTTPHQRRVAQSHLKTPGCNCEACVACRAAGIDIKVRPSRTYKPRAPFEGTERPRISSLPQILRRPAPHDMAKMPTHSLLRVLRGVAVGLKDVADYDRMPKATRLDIEAFIFKMDEVLVELAGRFEPPPVLENQVNLGENPRDRHPRPYKSQASACV